MNEEQLTKLREEWREYIKQWPQMDALGSADWWLAKVATAYLLGRSEVREQCAVKAWSMGMSLHMKEFDVREVGAKIAQAIRDIQLTEKQ